MRIYVAGASAEVDTIRAAIVALEERGFTITHDWTRDVLASRAAGTKDLHHSKEEQRAYAHADLDGVASADWFWLHTPEHLSIGAWVELGYAIAKGKRILVSGAHRSIFQTLATCTFERHEEAILFLTRDVRQMAKAIEAREQTMEIT